MRRWTRDDTFYIAERLSVKDSRPEFFTAVKIQVEVFWVVTFSGVVVAY
jgi:hypothetical protein